MEHSRIDLPMLRWLLLLSLLAIAACDNSPRLVVDGEVLAGKRADDGAVFLGVPFAEPPVGELRWRAPQPLQTRVGERDATHYAPACMQTMRILDWYRDLAEGFGGSRDYYADLDVSEDCLYLNVWTPTLNTDAQLPVMVWIHGGSNKSGWAYEPNYHGEALAPQGVIVVTVAYRQGAFGFLSHPDLEDPDAIANFGLWDLIAALQWVQDNIQQFGGDPDRVTLFGESAGAENILALMFVDAAQGLFHRGILQSNAGYGLAMPSLQDERERGAALGRLLDAESLEAMRSVSAEQLLATYTEHFDAHYHSPAIDGQLIAESTWESVRRGRNTGFDIMIGANADEYDDRTATANDFICPSQMLAAARNATGGNAWMYFFTRVREGRGGETFGAYHGAEYPYVFGSHDDYMPTTKQDLALSSTMQRYWLNFAAGGDPNGHGLPAWPRHEKPERRVLELGDDTREVAIIEPDLCAAFEALQAAQPALDRINQ